MSSSSDEDDVKLREALAPGFTIDAVKKSLSIPKGLEHKKSNRLEAKAKSTSSQFIAPVVSDDNQKYLAKELSKFLDSTIVEDDKLVKVSPALKKKEAASLNDDDGTGVRLFASSGVKLSSAQYIATDDAQELKRQSKKKIKIKKRRLADSEEISESEKVAQAAVSPEWVLEKKGDYGKLCRKPGELIEGAIQSWDKKVKLDLTKNQ